MQTIGADSSEWAGRMGGQLDAYMLDWACSKALCAPWTCCEAILNSVPAVPPNSSPSSPSTISTVLDDGLGIPVSGHANDLVGITALF